MTTDTSTLVPSDVAQLIATAVDAAGPSLSELPKAERLKHHRKKLNEIAFYQGIDGVTDYRKDHPEAAGIKVRMDARAYVPKRTG